MRYGVVSDIHGNLLALDAVLRAFAQIGTQEILCAGDIVGYGAQPNECVERLAGMGAVAVAGNHDLFAVDRLQARAPRLVSASTEWTRRVLSRDSVAYLEGLPLQASVPGITLAHGSLDHPLEYVGREDTAGAQLSLLSAAQPQASVLILGHTHRAMAYAGGRMIAQPRRCGVLDLPPGPALLNPGSVGQSRQVECPPRARALVLDWPPGSAPFSSPYVTTPAPPVAFSGITASPHPGSTWFRAGWPAWCASAPRSWASRQLSHQTGPGHRPPTRADRDLGFSRSPISVSSGPMICPSGERRRMTGPGVAVIRRGEARRPGYRLRHPRTRVPPAVSPRVATSGKPR